MRWTFFQAPLIVEDALGFKFPVPSEYDFELLNKIIKHRFLDGFGSLEVKVGNYELFNTKDSSQVISANVRLLPGTSITMAILISKPELADQEYPIPRCRSDRTTTVSGGGRLCCECDVWFDKSSKKRKSLQDLLDTIDQLDQGSRSAKRKLDQDNTPRKRAKTSIIEENVESFKNVRWTLEEIPAGDILETPKLQHPVRDEVINSETKELADNNNGAEALPLKPYFTESPPYRV